MSLSNPRQTNPASKFISWSGSKGQFHYYDKETDQKVFFEKPIYIVPLDELSTIKGFHDKSQSGIYSNEVKNLSKDILMVKAFKGGMIASGLYKDIKGQLEGGDFAKSVYAVLISGSKENLKLELVNISFHGSSLGSWIEAKVNVDSGNVIELHPSIEQLKKGTTIYFAPKIVKNKVRQDILDKCIQFDKDLQAYLSGYFAKPSEEREQITEAQAPDLPEITPEDDLPF